MDLQGPEESSMQVMPDGSLTVMQESSEWMSQRWALKNVKPGGTAEA